MYTKDHLITAKIASKSLIKSELACIAYCGDKVIATDTFRMLEVPVEGGLALKEPDLRLASSAKMPAGFIKVEDPLGMKPVNEGKYPDMDLVKKIHNEGKFVTINVNGKLFGELLTQMAKLNRYEKVTLRVPTAEYKAIMLEAPMGDINSDIKATGLMMPLNK